MTATFDQARHLLKVVAEKDISGKNLTTLHESGLLTDLLEASRGDLDAVDRTVFRHVLGLSPKECVVDAPKFVIEIDYDEAMKPARKGEPSGFEKLVAAGNYDWRNDDLNEKRFPIKGTGVRRFECRLFDGACSSKAGEQRIKDAGWKPAETEHLLVFGATYPEEQHKHPIMALDSPAWVHGRRFVPCLLRRSAKRSLALAGWAGVWPFGLRLLAVREISAASN